MHRSSRAPVLSATRSLDSCWIMSGSLRSLHDLYELPVLRLRQRTRLDDADDVADVRAVLLIVCVELRAAANDLLVARMRLDRVDLDDDRLVHRARDDDAAALLAPATLGLRLRRPADRLALGRALAHGLRALPALRARDVLALLLLLGHGCRLGRRLLLGGSLCLGCLFLGCRLFGRGLFGSRLFGRSLFDSLSLGRSLLGRGLFDRLSFGCLFVLLFVSHI